MADKNLGRVFLNSLVFVMAVALVAVLFISRTFILAGLTGLGVGCLASPFLTLLKRRFKVPRAIGAFILILILLLIFTGLFVLAGKIVADQWQTFQEQIPFLVTRIEQWWNELMKSYPLINQGLSDLSFGEGLRGGAMRLMRGLGTGVSLVAGFVLAFFIALYTAIHSDEYFKGWVSLFPRRHQGRVGQLSVKSADVLRKWFSAQLLDMAIVGGLTALGLWVTGVDYWAIFGAMTGLLAIIPYFGTLVTLLLVTLVTAASQPDQVLWVLLVFLVVQQIEGNLILPIIMKERVKLPEAPLLFFIILMSLWFGALGIVVAPGLFAIGRTLYIELFEEKTPTPQKS